MIEGDQMNEAGKKKRNHKGKQNPHFGHIMSDASRNAISESQKARFEFYKKAAANIMTEDRVREIIKETVQDYLANNVKPDGNNEKKININL